MWVFALDGNLVKSHNLKKSQSQFVKTTTVPDAIGKGVVVDTIVDSLSLANR